MLFGKASLAAGKATLAKLRECVLQDETEQVVKHIQTFFQDVFLDGYNENKNKSSLSRYNFNRSFFKIFGV